MQAEKASRHAMIVGVLIQSSNNDSSSKRKPAVFLDRDGVLNRALVREGQAYPPMDRSEVEILPGVVEACQRLKKAGFLLVVVANQPGVERGEQSRETVEQINAVVERQIPVDELLVCFHEDGDHCPCRKPQPTMLLDAAQRIGISLGESFLVGDRPRDIDAGKTAGCRTVLIGDAQGEAGTTVPDYRAASLEEAVPYILQAHA
jgi:D-glycero-D-manno-heptose 1,7-bisphosphate phosphatase